MRIGLIIYGSLETRTGGYLYDRIAVQGLERLGHEVEVISLKGGAYPRRLVPGFSFDLCQRLLAGKFDLLLQDELCHPSLFLVNRQLRRRQGPPLVAIVHHILCREPRARWRNRLLALVERRYLASVDGFICNSKTTRQTVTDLVGDRQPRVIAYPAGDRFGSPLSPEEISRRASQTGPLQLLFLGILIPRKGLLPLLGALAGIDRHLWRLTVVGGIDFDPAHTIEVRQAIAQLGLGDSVRFVGPCPDEDLIEILRSSHLFCMPYAYEGFGIGILEAMAFGLPAIGCRAGAAGETISHGTNGYLLGPDDRAGLKPLLAHLYHDREMLLQLSLAARATYADRPNWEDNVAAINGFLLEMRARHDQANVGGSSSETKTSETSFDPRYLAAKKSIDDRALNRFVWETLRQALPRTTGSAPVHILEIGAGIGTMLARIVDWDLLTGPATYVATDCEAGHLRLARHYLSEWATERGHALSWSGDQRGLLCAAGHEITLVFEAISAEELALRTASKGTFNLIIAHAVLDLIDLPVVLPGLLTQLTDKGLAYLTCNFDGDTCLLPEYPDGEEQEILRRYHASMEARLAGASRTGRRLLSLLQRPGLELLAAGSSDWVTHPWDAGYSADEAFFLHALIATVERELAKVNPPAGLAVWARTRHQQVEAGTLSLLVRNLDLLARRQPLS